MSETLATTATYDQIAAAYVARPGLVETMRATRRRFAARLRPGARVLDAGCGPAHETVLLRALGLQAIGLDRSRGMLAEARSRPNARAGDIPLLLGDMRRLPLLDDSLDGLWACASFLHIPKRDAPAVLGEFWRTLGPGGMLYVGVKRGDGERWIASNAWPPRFFAFYQPDELDEYLKAAGFTIAEHWQDGDPLGGDPWLGRFATT